MILQLTQPYFCLFQFHDDADAEISNPPSPLGGGGAEGVGSNEGQRGAVGTEQSDSSSDISSAGGTGQGPAGVSDRSGH